MTENTYLVWYDGGYDQDTPEFLRGDRALEEWVRSEYGPSHGSGVNYKDLTIKECYDYYVSVNGQEPEERHEEETRPLTQEEIDNVISRITEKCESIIKEIFNFNNRFDREFVYRPYHIRPTKKDFDEEIAALELLGADVSELREKGKNIEDAEDQRRVYAQGVVREQLLNDPERKECKIFDDLTRAQVMLMEREGYRKTRVPLLINNAIVDVLVMMKPKMKQETV